MQYRCGDARQDLTHRMPQGRTLQRIAVARLMSCAHERQAFFWPAVSPMTSDGCGQEVAGEGLTF